MVIFPCDEKWLKFHHKYFCFMYKRKTKKTGKRLFLQGFKSYMYEFFAVVVLCKNTNFVLFIGYIHELYVFMFFVSGGQAGSDFYLF